MICDVHAHYIPKNSSDYGRSVSDARWRTVKRGIARYPVSDSPEDIQGFLDAMDSDGVEKQV